MRFRQALQRQTIRAVGNTPLTLDQIRRVAPSVFATQPHESRSSRYAFIPTSAVVDALMQNGFQPFQATQSLSRDFTRRDFTKHMLRFRHPDMMAVARVGGAIPEVVLVNGHDGSTRYKLMAGIFRLVCENGAIVADSLVGSVNVQHTGKVIEEVTHGSIQIVEHMPEVIDAVARWKAINLVPAERTLLAEAAHTLRFADADGKVNTPVRVDQLLSPRRREDTGTDLWTTYNVVQENVMKGGLRAYNTTTHRRASTREVKGIDQDVKLNRALWTLATKMAELKEGVVA